MTAAFDADAFAHALLAPDAATPEGLRAWNGSDVTRRLNVHRNNVIVSLVDALVDTFAVVAQAVGEPFYRAMAASYARQSPPTSTQLWRHGEGLADFIAKFEPARPLPWLSDLARLEFARLQAWHAADAAPTTPERWSQALARPDALARWRTPLHPSVRVLISNHAVVSIWRAHQLGDDPSGLAHALQAINPATPEACLVLRDADDAVLVLPVPLASARFIQALGEGLNWADAIEAATVGSAAIDGAMSPRSPRHNEAFDLTTTLQWLIAHPLLIDTELPS
jgi:hypothetical protein